MPTKNVKEWFDRHPKAREWAWFVALWCGGLLAVVTFTYPIKMIIRSMR